MLTDAELQDILYRIDNDMANWRDRARLRAHVEAQAATIAERDQTIAQLRAEVDAHDAALQRRDAEIAALKRETQAPPGWHKLFMATPTLPIEISVNGVPIPLHNGASTEEM